MHQRTDFGEPTIHRECMHFVSGASTTRDRKHYLNEVRCGGISVHMDIMVALSCATPRRRPRVALLRGSIHEKEHAAGALEFLARNDGNCVAIVHGGCHQPSCDTGAHNRRRQRERMGRGCTACHRGKHRTRGDRRAGASCAETTRPRVGRRLNGNSHLHNLVRIRHRRHI